MKYEFFIEMQNIQGFLSDCTAGRCGISINSVQICTFYFKPKNFFDGRA